MRDLDLYYLGTREYVNGLTLFEQMVAAFLRAPEGAGRRIDEVVLFKASQFVRRQCAMDIAPPGRTLRLRDAAVRLDLATDAGRFTLLLFQQERPVTERREEYDRTAYVADRQRVAVDAVRAAFRNVSDAFELLRGIVEVNHQLTREESSVIGVHDNPSWAYMTHYRMPQPEDLSRRPPEAMFTLKGVTTAGGLRYTIREVAVAEWPLPVELCFFTRVPQARLGC